MIDWNMILLAKTGAADFIILFNNIHLSQYVVKQYIDTKVARCA